MELDRSEDGDDMQTYLTQRSGSKSRVSVPQVRSQSVSSRLHTDEAFSTQIYIRGTLIGGNDDLQAFKNSRKSEWGNLVKAIKSGQAST